jgi:hypothetical protein
MGVFKVGAKSGRFGHFVVWLNCSYFFLLLYVCLFVCLRKEKMDEREGMTHTVSHEMDGT